MTAQGERGTEVAEAATEADAAPEVVWRALTDERERRAWWPDMHLDAVVGGAVRATWEEGGAQLTSVGTVREVVAAERLTFTWSDEDWEAITTVTVRLRPTAGGTRVTVREDGFAQLADGARIAAEHRAGWQHHLDRLRDHLVAD